MKAQNRKEIFLKALANGEEPKIKPLTREEKLLAKQAKRESKSFGGDCDWNTMKNKPFGETTVTGDTLTWDGNTEGLVCVSDVFYKVSELKPELENGTKGATIVLNVIAEDVTETTTGNMTDVVGDGILLCCNDTETSSAVFIATEKAIGVETDFGVISETGIYFAGVEGEFYVSSFTIHDITEITPLPNKYLDIIETVGGDTLTWDGNTSARYVVTIEGEETTNYYVHVSDATPSIDELANGYTADGIADNYVEDLGGGALMTSFGAVIPTDNNSDSGVTFEKKGVYFIGGDYGEGITYITSLTISGYTGFTKEQVKQEYLPSGMVIDVAPTFDEANSMWIEESASYTPILAHIEKGGNVTLKMPVEENVFMYLPIMSAMSDPEGLVVVVNIEMQNMSMIFITA